MEHFWRSKARTSWRWRSGTNRSDPRRIRPTTRTPRAPFGYSAAIDHEVIADTVDWYDEQNVTHAVDAFLDPIGETLGWTRSAEERRLQATLRGHYPGMIGKPHFVDDDDDGNDPQSVS